MESSSFGRLVSVLVSPEKTFRSIAERPTWFVPLLVLLVLGAGTSFLIFTKVDGEAMVRSQMERSGRTISEEQMEQAVAMGSKMKYVAPAASVFIIPVFYLAVAGILLVAFRLQGSEIGFAGSLATWSYASMPSGVKALLHVPVVLAKEEIPIEAAQAGAVLASNLAAFAPENAGPALLGLLSSVDVFSIWIVVLLAIGYRIVAKVSARSAGITVTLVWLLGVAIKVGLASLGS